MTDPPEIDVDSVVGSVATHVARRYHGFVTRDDLISEMQVYRYGDGAHLVDRCVANGERFRLQRALSGAAVQYALGEKAAQSGFSPDDVAWYSPEKLVDLLPLALDEGWDGLTGQSEQEGSGHSDGREGGTLLAMVCDIRRALALPGGPELSQMSLDAFDPETEDGMRQLEWLADRLGGEYPDSPGYRRGRRAIPNSTAIALSHQDG